MMIVKTNRSSLAKTQAPSSQQLSHETMKIFKPPPAPANASQSPVI
jgi:hypothetical protein